MASFAFAKSPNLLQPSRIDGYAPPALAIKICEPMQYSFTAVFGPFPGAACGSREAVSVATVGIPNTATVINSEETTQIDIVGCPEPLPVVSIDANQAPVKGSYVWTITRRMVAVGRKHADTAVTVAGPGSPTSETAVLALSAKHQAGSQPGAYAKFNQTIIVKRTKPSYDEKQHMYEVRGQMWASGENLGEQDL